jgi:outer membrane protein, heavy metal efflux system
MQTRIIYHALLGSVSGLLIAGCTSPPQRQGRPAPPVGRVIRGVGANGPAGESAHDNPTGTLALGKVLSLALLQHPELAAFSHEMRAADARARQSGLRLNPLVEVELEEYDRDGEGIRSSETMISVKQPFRLGKQRHWRTRAADAQGALAAWDYESKRIDVLTETAERFMTVIAAKRHLELARLTVAVAERTGQAVTERVKAGKAPALQVSKASAELGLSRIGVLQAENRVQVSRLKLAAMWGSEQPVFESLVGELASMLPAVPDMAALRTQLAENPAIARWDAEIRLREAELAAAKSARIPIVKAKVALAQYREDETDALTVGIGAPLPLFDRNQGNIAAARHGLAKARALRRAAEVDLLARFSEARVNLISANNRVRTLRSKVVPAMEEAAGAAHEGYRQGKFRLLDVLDAQRGLFESKGALVNAQLDYHVALVQIQRLTGKRIEELVETGKEEI